MIGDDNDEKVLQFIKIFILILESIILGILGFILFGVSQVEAAPTNYPIDVWSMYQNGSDSGALTPGTTAFTDWSYSSSQQSYVNIIFPAHNGVVTAHARVETNQQGAYVKFNYYVWIGSQLQNINVSLQPSGNNNENIDIYFNAVNDTNQAITLQLKPNVLLLPPLSNNVRVSFKVTGSEDVEPSDSLSNDTFINATNNQTTTIVNNITDNVNELKNGFINALDENNKMCITETKDLIGIENGRLTTNGTVTSNENLKVTDYIKIDQNKSYTLNSNYNASGYYYCLYNEEKINISCSQEPNTTNITITNGNYVRFTIDDRYGRKLTLNGKFCQTNTEATINAIDDLSFMQRERWTEEDEQEAQRNNLISQIISGVGNIFGFLQDDDIDDPSTNISSLENDMISDAPISNLFLLPVTLYQKVINSINGTCNSINLGQLWGSDLIMTCISIPSIIGNALYSVIDVLISGFFILSIRKKFIEIFENLTSLHTRRNELE